MEMEEMEPLQQRIACLALPKVLLRVGDGSIKSSEDGLGPRVTLCTMDQLWTID
jgi:hypothetical protein